MAEIPLPPGIDEVEGLPQTRTALWNCFNNGAQVIPRPGIRELADVSGEQSVSGARGLFEWNGHLYGVYGTTLRKFTNPSLGESQAIGTISGSNPVRTAVGFNEVVIVDPGGELFEVDKSDVITNLIGATNFESCADVAHINGRFVYIPSDGDPAFFSDVGDAGTVQADSFFDAEELPDENKVVFNFGNTLFIGGDQSIELYRDVGAFPVPFQKLQGASIRNGVIGSVLQYADTVLFLGREEGQDAGFFALGNGNAIKISNQVIDKKLSEYTLDSLALGTAGRLKWRGYDIATFNLANDSWGFYNGTWFHLDTIKNELSRPWDGGFVAEFDGKYYSASGSKFGVFEHINLDYGNPVTRQMDFGFPHPNNRRFSCQSLELGLSQGFNSNEGTVGIQLSRNNVEYGSELYRNVGGNGKYSNKLVFNYAGGLGNYDGFMGVRVFTRQDVDFAIRSMYVNLR